MHGISKPTWMVDVYGVHVVYRYPVDPMGKILWVGVVCVFLNIFVH